MSTCDADLDSLNCPLDGVNLIAAAAGTGKTHNIQNLVMRLLIEKRLPIESILVVTFTEAAAAELRDRIRLILERTLAELTGHSVAIPGSREAELVAAAAARRAPELTPELWRQDATELVRRGLLDFDSAAIGTIHGFCARVLREHAFESGVVFNCALEENSTERLRKITADFYRKIFYDHENGPVATMLATATGLTLPQLVRLVRLAIERPELRFKYPAAEFDGTVAEACDAARRELEFFRSPNATESFAELGEIFKSPYNAKGFGELAGELSRFRVSGTPTDGLLTLLTTFTIGRMREYVTKKFMKRPGWERELAQYASCGFLRHTGQFAACADFWNRHFLQQAVHEVGRNYTRAKSRENIQTFDDMLRQVRDVLYSPGAPLAAVLRKRFPAGIIDEFQDTDPVQYEIFSKLFLAPEKPGTLFLVGDPRQAIYAFRGGDIETYRKAVRDLDATGGRRYILRANFRSSKPMIEAVNRLFHDHAQPFADAEIGFPEVLAPPVTPDGAPRPGMLLDAVEETLPLKFTDISGYPAGMEAVLTAQLVVELLTSSRRELPAPDGGSPRRIEPGDITILIRDGYEGRAVKRELARRRIPAVLARIGSVFKTPEAAELLLFLRAVAFPAGTGNIQTALATALGGQTLDTLLSLQTPAGENERLLLQERFVELRKLWESSSFYAMFHRMLTLFEVRERCPKLRDGERRLTNFLQLGDLLEQESARRQLGVNGVIALLETAIRDADDRNCPEDQQQLLETDRAAVGIMTIHGSKGLEFPIVIVPGLFKLQAKRDRRAPYHAADGALELDLSDAPESRECEENELLREHLRLAYVAITRAALACFCFVGKSQLSPLDWLFKLRRAGRAELDSPYRALRGEAIGQEPEIPAGMELPIGPDPGSFRPAADGSAPPYITPWIDRIDRNWRCTSYSRLAPQGDGKVATAPADYDDDEPEVEVIAPAPGAVDPFLFPGGKAAGTALHAILEEIDFDAPIETIRRAARPALQTYGLLRAPEVAAERIEIAAQMIAATLKLPLADAAGNTFCLAGIGRGDRLSELEFHYAFRRGFATAALRRQLEDFARDKFGLAEWPPWERAFSGGFLTGVIDLVFRRNRRYYIIDWKSNRLDGNPANFIGPKLAGAMCHGFYFLQYLIYTVALVKYLRLRLGRFGRDEYEQYFGGIYYIFLRGAPSGNGVFRDRPDYGLIRELEELIG